MDQIHPISNNQPNGLGDLVDEIPNPPEWLKHALAVPREEGYVDVDGCDIHYFRWGDKSKPGILMTHGFLAHARCFAFIAPYLAEDYHIVAFDMSGMGDSGTHQAFSEEIRVRELVGVAEQTGLCANGAKPTIIAHSFGGLIGTATVEAYPDKFAGLVICDLMIMRPSILAANKDKFGPPGNRDPKRPHRIYENYPAAKKRFVLSPPQATNQQVLFDYMAYHSLKKVDGGWRWKFSPAVFNRETDVQKKWSNIGERLVKAPGRKVIIYGRESFLFTPDSAEYMRELITEHQVPDIPIIDIPNARHHLMLDEPIAFVSALKSVLEIWS